MTTHGHYAPPARRVDRAVGVTGSGGDVTFTWSPPFDAPPVIEATVQAGAGFRSLRIAANTGGSTTVHVDVSAGVTLLGIGVLAVGAAASGVTVHCTATAP
ncbi:hypothetical protein [Streptomyces sp. SID11385]|uniref:hypothetical protein n=1 Tax=Streptomyces sp. SID11385 TaxID=2706031 RepID=UPI0013C568DB|nr:hypothetical protein [Streptomyces sp. SID11385]NEA39273.1 hypothetical protein [Streptomyces sp. SID11385]